MTALILGFFAFVWFGWGQAAAHGGLSLALGAGSVVGVLIAGAGGIVIVRSPNSSTPMADPHVRRQYYVVVGLEFAVLIAGAVTLSLVGQSAYIAAWVCTGVGLHFLPLSRVLADQTLIPLGLLVGVVGAVAAATGVATTVAPSTVAGVGAGALLAIFGFLNLAGAPRSDHRARHHAGSGD